MVRGGGEDEEKRKKERISGRCRFAPARALRRGSRERGFFFLNYTRRRRNDGDKGERGEGGVQDRDNSMYVIRFSRETWSFSLVDAFAVPPRRVSTLAVIPAPPPPTTPAYFRRRWKRTADFDRRRRSLRREESP